MKTGDKDLFTSSEAGELLQMNPSSIKRWIDEGRLLAFRTPGGHRRIRAADLVTFLDAHDIPIPAELQNAARRRVLVVDDDRNHLRALQRALKKWRQLEVVTCDDGIDALVLVGSFRPHLILLDVFMPNVDGLEVCRRLKANPDTKDIHVVVVTGHKTPQLTRKALEAGASLTIEKPIAVPDLLEVLGISPGSGRRVTEIRMP